MIIFPPYALPSPAITSQHLGRDANSMKKCSLTPTSELEIECSPPPKTRGFSWLLQTQGYCVKIVITLDNLDNGLAEQIAFITLLSL